MLLSLKTGYPRWLFYILVTIAILNGTKLFKSGFTPDSPSDFRTVYAGQKLLAQGKNPYYDQKVKAAWQEIIKSENLTSETAPGFPETPLVYPPWALVLFMPFSLLFYSKAYLLWYAVLPLLLYGMLRQVQTLCRRYFQLEIPFMDLLVTALAFKSTFPALLVGQPLFLCLFLGFTALVYAEKNKVLSGILLGLATFKITLALPFMLIFAFRRDWKTLCLAAFTGFVLLGIAFLLVPDGMEMLQSYRATIAELYRNAFAVSGAELPYFMPLLTEFGTVLVYLAPKLFSYLNLLYFGFLLCCFWLLRRKIRLVELKEGYLFLLCALLTLLCTYHLLYDCLLLLPLLGFMRQQSKKWQVAAGLFCSVFFLPVNGILQALPLPKAFDLLYFTTPLALLGLLVLVLFAPKPTPEQKPAIS
jgi:hypothetical protein